MEVKFALFLPAGHRLHLVNWIPHAISWWDCHTKNEWNDRVINRLQFGQWREKAWRCAKTCWHHVSLMRLEHEILSHYTRLSLPQPHSNLFLPYIPHNNSQIWRAFSKYLTFSTMKFKYLPWNLAQPWIQIWSADVFYQPQGWSTWAFF